MTTRQYRRIDLIDWRKVRRRAEDELLYLILKMFIAVVVSFPIAYCYDAINTTDYYRIETPVQLEK